MTPRVAMLCIHTCPLARLGGKDAGGMNVYVQNLSHHLGRLGYPVDVFTRKHNGDHPGEASLGPNTRLIHIDGGHAADGDKLSLYEHTQEFAARIESFRRQDNQAYDLVFSHYWISGLVGWLLAQQWQTPALQMFHTLGVNKNKLDGEKEPGVRLASETLLARESSGIIASTAREARLLDAKLGADRSCVSVIPCGVDLDLFRPLDKPLCRRELGINAERLVLFVGRIETLKGLNRLIEAVSRLEAPGLQLMIVGGDEHSRAESDNLKGLAQRLGVDRRVSFRDSVPQEKLPGYYSAADVFVLPSHYESFGMVALEALACGTPVVASPVGDLQNIIDEGVTGYIARDNSPTELASKLGLALGDTLARPEEIRRSVVRFGWESIARQVAARCETVVQAAAPAGTGCKK